VKLRHFPGTNLLYDIGTQSVKDYVDEKPSLDLREFLNGPISGSGAFFGFGAKQVRRFTITMNGSWSGNVGKIEEEFCYHDGEKGDRCWNMNFGSAGSFTATAHDVVDQAHGLQCGNSSLMRYKMIIPRGKGQIIVSMEDWFFLMEDGILINRARMTKFGLKVGEIIASFQKNPQGSG